MSDDWTENGHEFVRSFSGIKYCLKCLESYAICHDHVCPIEGRLS